MCPQILCLVRAAAEGGREAAENVQGLKIEEYPKQCCFE
jgi:hypothetical protein